MVLQEIGGGGYDYAQSSTPSSAEIGETWLDSTVSPPQSKVYNGSSWVSTDAMQKVIDNVDTPISSVGGVSWANKTPQVEQSTLQSFVTNSTTTMVSISGSGYVTEIQITASTPFGLLKGDIKIDGSSILSTTSLPGNSFSENNQLAEIYYSSQDGSDLPDVPDNWEPSTKGIMKFKLLHRFESGVEVIIKNESDSVFGSGGARVNYVLD